MASTFQILAKAAGILAAVVWGYLCWNLLAQQDVNATAQEMHRDFRLLGLAAISTLVVGFLVYWPFAALAEFISESGRHD